MTDSIHHLTAATAPLARRVTAGVARVLRAVRAAWWRRRTALILASLDDRALRDIGVNRGEIGEVVEHRGRRD